MKGSTPSAPGQSDLRQAALRGVRWVLAGQRDDGSYSDPDEGVGSYYKVPYLPALSGHHGAAHRLLDWIARHHLAEDGDFRSPLRKSLRATHTRRPDYANAWIVMGAALAGRWDLCYRGIRAIEAHRNPQGGFEAVDDGERYLEPVNTSWAGMACLTTGRVEAARGAADLMVRMVHGQPSPSTLYFRMRPDGTLITTPAAGRSPREYAVSATEPRQIAYNPGIAAILLASVHLATGEAEYLEAARDLVGFCDRCLPDIYTVPPSGKLGMACALVHRYTGDPLALRGAREVGAYLLRTQRADGSWQLPPEDPYLDREDRQSYGTTLDLTAEFAVFLLHMSALLESRAG